MGKVKDNLFEGLSQEEINDMLYNRYKDEVEYQEWLESEGFVEYVNGEIDSTKPRYSESDIMGATRYASKSIIYVVINIPQFFLKITYRKLPYLPHLVQL